MPTKIETKTHLFIGIRIRLKESKAIKSLKKNTKETKEGKSRKGKSHTGLGGGPWVIKGMRGSPVGLCWCWSHGNHCSSPASPAFYAFLLLVYDIVVGQCPMPPPCLALPEFSTPPPPCHFSFVSSVFECVDKGYLLALHVWVLKWMRRRRERCVRLGNTHTCTGQKNAY